MSVRLLGAMAIASVALWSTGASAQPRVDGGAVWAEVPDDDPGPEEDGASGDGASDDGASDDGASDDETSVDEGDAPDDEEHEPGASMQEVPADGLTDDEVEDDGAIDVELSPDRPKPRGVLSDESYWGDEEGYYDPTVDDPWQRKRRRRFSMKLGVGPMVRGIFDVPHFGGEVELSLGGRSTSRKLIIYGTVIYSRSETLHGLDVHRAVAGATFDIGAGRWRGGVGPRFGLVMIDRVTDGRLMWGFGLGGEGMVSVDLVQGEQDDAFYMALHGGLLVVVPTADYGAALRLGYRL